MKGKKGDIMLGLILIIVLVVLGISIWDKVAGGECKSNKDCGEDSYCSVDKTCQAFPVIEHTIIKQGLTMPAIILALSIIIAASILKWKGIGPGT